MPSHHQSASFVFTHVVNNTGWHSTFYVLLLGLLLAQYTFTGYDASAHMTEETHKAATAGPRGIVSSIVVSLIAGWVLLIGVTFAIQHYTAEVTSATGVPPAQIFIDAAGVATGKFLLLVVIGAQLFCGMSSVTANSRMIYAFSRDGALPGSSFWHKVNKRTRTPTNAIWLAAVFAFVLGLPYLWNATAYAAVTSIAVIGLYIAYVLPHVPAAAPGPRDFRRGPWHLGRVEHAHRDHRGHLGGLHHDPVHAAPRPAPSPFKPSTTPWSRCWSSWGSPGSGGWSRPGSGSPGPGSRARPRNWPRSSRTWPGDHSDWIKAVRVNKRWRVGRQTALGLEAHGEAAWGNPAHPAPRDARPRAAPTWRCTRATSTPSWSPSPTCRDACRASGWAAEFFLDDVVGQRHRGLQLPARGGRGDEHRRGVRDVVLADRLRRLRDGRRT